MKKGYRPIQMDFHGKVYTAHRLGERYHLSPTTLKYRYHQGMRGDDLVAPPLDSASRVHIGSHVYTLQGLARHYHVPLNTVESRYADGKRGQELTYDSSPRRIRFNGRSYTFAELSAQYHLHTATVYGRYRRGDRQWALVRPPKSHQDTKPRQSHKYHRIWLHGKHYSYRSLAAATGISSYTIRKRYRQGMRGTNLVRTPQRTTQIVRDPQTHKKTTLRHLSQEYGINYGTLRNRYLMGSRGHHLIRPTKNIQRHISVEGKRYTFRELSRHSGTNLYTILDRYYQRGLRGRDLIQPPYVNRHSR